MDNSNDIEIIELDIMGGDCLKPEEENNDSHSSGNGHSGKNNSKRPKKKSSKKGSSQFSPKGRYIAGLAIGIALAVIAIVFLIYLFILDILPIGYLIAAIIVLCGLAAAVIYTQRQKRSKLQLAGMIVGGLLCIVLGFGIFYLYKTNEMLDKITDNTESYDIITYNVAVLKNDPAEKLEDTKNYKFGICKNLDKNIDSALEELNKEMGTTVKTTNYDSIGHLAEALYKKQIKVIIYNDSFTSTIEEGYENWDKDVRIIKVITVKKKADTKPKGTADVTKNPFIVYISGSDQYGELSMTSRSDVNMLVAVNPVSHQVLLLSTPRDYYVTFPGITGDERDKLTHAGIYGMDEQIDTMENLYGYEIEYYVKVNFSSLIEIVDAIGGVTIENEFAFTSVDGYYYPEGTLDLDGTYALHYARERHAFQDGDFARGRHQQQIIVAIMDKLFSSTGMTKYTALTDALENCAVTNMAKSDITAIIKMQLADSPHWEITSAQAEGDSMYQPCFVVGNSLLSVTMPYYKSIENVKIMLAQLVSGEKVTKLQLQEGDDYSYVVSPKNTDGYSFIGEDEEEEMEIEVETTTEAEEYEGGEEDTTYYEEGGEEDTTPYEGGEEDTTPYEDETTTEAPPEETTPEAPPEETTPEAPPEETTPAEDGGGEGEEP